MLLAVLALAVMGTTAVMADGPKPRKITKIASTVKKVYAGSEFELKARMYPRYSDDDYLRWSIIGKKGIIAFDDDDRNDDEVEFRALRAGTTKVRCSIKGRSSKYSKTFTVTVRKPSYTVSQVGKKTVRVERGDDFELKVRKNNKRMSDRYLKWTIKNTKILRFEDGDRYGDEVELEARRTGTTTVKCTNLKTKKSITYTVRVVPDYDDDDDDD